MRVNHGGADVGVSEQFLDGADVLAVFQQVRGEAVPQGMASGMFVDPGALDGDGHGFFCTLFS